MDLSPRKVTFMKIELSDPLKSVGKCITCRDSKWPPSANLRIEFFKDMS